MFCEINDWKNCSQFDMHERYDRVLVGNRPFANWVGDSSVKQFREKSKQHALLATATATETSTQSVCLCFERNRSNPLTIRILCEYEHCSISIEWKSFKISRIAVFTYFNQQNFCLNWFSLSKKKYRRLSYKLWVTIDRHSIKCASSVYRFAYALACIFPEMYWSVLDRIDLAIDILSYE